MYIYSPYHTVYSKCYILAFKIFAVVLLMDLFPLLCTHLTKLHLVKILNFFLLVVVEGAVLS